MDRNRSSNSIDFVEAETVIKIEKEFSRGAYSLDDPGVRPREIPRDNSTIKILRLPGFRGDIGHPRPSGGSISRQ